MYWIINGSSIGEEDKCHVGEDCVQVAGEYHQIKLGND